MSCGCNANSGVNNFSPSDVQGLEPPAWSYEPGPLVPSAFFPQMGGNNILPVAIVGLLAVGAYYYFGGSKKKR